MKRAKPFKGRVIVVRGQLIGGVYGDTEAESILRSIRRRYTKMGLTPPPMTTTPIHSREWLDSWVAEDIHRQVTKSSPEGS